MKIASVTTTPIRMPIVRAPYSTERAGTKKEWDRGSRISPKRPTQMLEYLIVRIETDEDVAGIGEAPVDIGFFGQTLEQVQAAIDDYLGPQIVVHLRLGEHQLVFLDDPADDLAVGDLVECRVSYRRLHHFDTVSGQALAGQEPALA